MKQEIKLHVNGQIHRLAVATRRTLLDVLRRELKLFSVRLACGIGMCGACTVLVDGKPISACLALAAAYQHVEIVTVEGLPIDGTLDPIQQAFIKHNAFQCSYCTPGFILSAKALLAENPNPSRAEIRHYLAGNLCRCGSYVNILEAVEEAAEDQA